MLISGHSRTIKAKKNIYASFIIKGVDILIGLLLVPLYLKYLGQTLYGTWLTITSIVMWFRFLNLGLGNGLRNKFIEAKANNDYEKVRYYISTTYVIISIIVPVFIIIFFCINPFINWVKILKIDEIYADEINLLVIITFLFFGLTLIVNLINVILLADQSPAKSNLLNLITRSIILLGIYVLFRLNTKSIVYVGIVYSATPVMIYIIASIYFFSKKYKTFRPSIKYFQLKYVKDLTTLGLKFFYIQLTAIVLYTADNFIITQLFSARDVAPYQIANKYFNIPYMFFLIILQPMWAAAGDAYHRKEFLWLKKTEKSLLLIWLLFSFGILLMLIFSNWVYHIWLGNQITIEYGISLAWAIFIIISSYNAIYTNFINGIGKLRIQLLIATYSLIAKIPLSILFASSFKWGVQGVAYATLTSILLSSFFKTVQFKKLAANTAYGIWIK